MTLLFTVVGGFIAILITVIGFFLQRVVTDVRKAIEEIGKNKGRIELVEQKLESESNRLNQLVQSEVRLMSERVEVLSNNMNDMSKNTKELLLILAGKKTDG